VTGRGDVTARPVALVQRPRTDIYRLTTNVAAPITAVAPGAAANATSLPDVLAPLAGAISAPARATNPSGVAVAGRDHDASRVLDARRERVGCGVRSGLRGRERDGGERQHHIEELHLCFVWLVGVSGLALRAPGIVS
jgi:hypothetical protein